MFDINEGEIMKYKKFVSTILLSCFLFMLLPISAFATTLGTKITATIPTFKVTMNGQVVDNNYREYPFLVYKDITYFPMTYWDMRFLGVSNTWTAETGSVIITDGSTSDYRPTLIDVKNKTKNIAIVNTGAFQVNGKVIDNAKEEYPILAFRDVPYFPLTWDWCKEFGWNVNFDIVNGLTVNTVAKATNNTTNNNDSYGKPKQNPVKIVGEEKLLDNCLIRVDGNRISAKAAYIDNVYYVPIDAVCEALGLEVEYDINTALEPAREHVNIIASNYLRTGEDTKKHLDYISVCLNDCGYHAYIDDIRGGNEKGGHIPVLDKKYYVGAYNYYLQMNPVRISNVVYIDARAICYPVGAPLTISNNEISIGKCFSSNDVSMEKIKEIVSTKPPKLEEIPTQTQVSTSSNNENLTNNISEAYLNIIQDKLKTRGFINPSTVDSIGGNFYLKEEGLLFAKLIDFDNDGVRELFLLESLSKRKNVGDYSYDSIDPYYQIYTYSDGKAKLLTSAEVLFSDSASEFGFSTAKNGISYFYIDAFEHEEFYTINNGVWTKTSLSVSSRYDWSASGTVNGKHVWIHSNTATITGGYIDGKSVTYDELVKYKNNLTANNHEYYGAVVDKMPDGTIQKVINELSNMN